MEKLNYSYNCVNPIDIDELNFIVDEYTEITYKTFRKNVNTEDFDMLCSDLGYTVGNEKGLHIKHDWSVSFRKSRYKGYKIYYFVQSAIEYVFK